MPDFIHLRIKRQDAPGSAPYWESFSVPWQPNMNVISALMEIQVNPVNSAGKRVAPVIWDSCCLEEVCGVCSMRINGKPRQACTALVDQLEHPITIEPFTKFPVVRDLMIDRSRMFESLKRVKAWVPLDGTHHLGEGPKVNPEDAEEMYTYSRCMTCGCCLEACPQVNENSPFIGAAAIGQAYLFNMNPTGAMMKGERLDEMMGPGGISDCGNAQNCVEACPKEIPLATAIAVIGRDTTIHAVKRLLNT